MPFTVENYNDIVSGLGVLGGVGFQIADAVNGNNPGASQVTQTVQNTNLPTQSAPDYTIAYILIGVTVLAILVGLYLMYNKSGKNGG